MPIILNVTVYFLFYCSQMVFNTIIFFLYSCNGWRTYFLLSCFVEDQYRHVGRVCCLFFLEFTIRNKYEKERFQWHSFS